MAFQFIMWVPEVAMVEKRMLVDRSGDDNDDGKAVPRPSEARPEDDDEDMLMPPLHELVSGNGKDLVKVRLLALTKLVLASDPAFAQYSSARMVHDVHVLDASAWPGLTPKTPPAPVGLIDSKALPVAPKTAPVSMPAGQAQIAAPGAPPQFATDASGPDPSHAVTASAPPGALAGPAPGMAQAPVAEALAPPPPPIPAAGVIEAKPSSEGSAAEGDAPPSGAGDSRAEGSEGGPATAKDGASTSPAPASGAAPSAEAVAESRDRGVSLPGVDDDAQADDADAESELPPSQAGLGPLAPPDDDDASAFVKPNPADATTGRGAVILFRTIPGEADHVLSLLAEQLGIGRDDLPQCGTISIMPVELTKPRSAMIAPEIEEEEEEEAEKGPAGAAGAAGVAGQDRTGKIGGSVAKGLSAKSGDRQQARSKVRARVLVDKILDQIAQGAALSFDYVAMVSVASILAGVGLATNNAVVIVASMLVSPLMAPVLALTFGLFICDWRLARLGFCTELVGLLLCVFFGFLTGLVIAPLAEFEDITGGVWPTSEMTSRGTDLGLIVGVVVALASGCGVALGIAGNNVSGLVGVAISASLLPPIVNAGMLWSYCLSLLWLTGPIADGARPTWEGLISMGGYSLALALVNIACIIIAATGMFMVKEVAPIAGKSLLFSGTTAAVRRMFIAQSGAKEDHTGAQGTGLPGEGEVGPNAGLDAAQAHNGSGSGGGAAAAALARRREPKPIGMERAIRLVVDSGWHRELAPGKSGRSHRGHGSEGDAQRAAAKIAGASPKDAAAAAAAAAAAGAGATKGRAVGPARSADQKPVSDGHRMSADGSHATVGHGAAAGRSFVRRRTPRTDPRRAAVELASGDRFGIRARRGARRGRGGDDDGFDTYEVTRQLDMSDFGGRSMWGGRPNTLRGQVDASLAEAVRPERSRAGAAGSKRGGEGRMGLAEIMSKLAKGRTAEEEEGDDGEEEDEFDDEARDDPGRMPSRAARAALRGAAHKPHHSTLGLTRTVMSRRRMGSSAQTSLHNVKWG